MSQEVRMKALELNICIVEYFDFRVFLFRAFVIDLFGFRLCPGSAMRFVFAIEAFEF